MRDSGPRGILVCGGGRMAIDRSALVPFSQTDIAALSGMSRQRTNEALQKLQAAGLLALGRFGIKVLDLERLRDF